MRVSQNEPSATISSSVIGPFVYRLVVALRRPEETIYGRQQLDQHAGSVCSTRSRRCSILVCMAVTNRVGKGHDCSERGATSVARDQLGDVKSKLDNALQQVADQGKEIAELRQTRVEAAKVDRLVQSNTAIREDLNVVMTSTSVLSQTLNVGHLVGVAPIPAGPSITKPGG